LRAICQSLELSFDDVTTFAQPARGRDDSSDVGGSARAESVSVVAQMRRIGRMRQWVGTIAIV